MLINNPDKESKNMPICTCGKTQNKPYCDGTCDHIDEPNAHEDDKESNHKTS